MVHSLAEIESRILRPGQTPWLRLLFFKLVGVEFSRPLFIGSSFILYRGGSLKIGQRACIGERCGIFTHAAVEIGNDFLAAPGLTINSGDHNPSTLIPEGDPVVIGDRVWCGVNVTILAGVTIGDDCVIGAGALVRQSMPANTIAVGVPARPVKRNIRNIEKVWTCYPR